MNYEIKKGTRVVNGNHVDTYTTEIVSANMLEVEVGTTGYMGGDSGHGGRTYFRINDLGGTDIEVNVIGEGEFEVLLGGDCELSTIIEALKFITEVLERSANGKAEDETNNTIDRIEG